MNILLVIKVFRCGVTNVGAEYMESTSKINLLLFFYTLLSRYNFTSLLAYYNFRSRKRLDL